MAIDITKKDQLWKDYQANLSQAQREAELARRQADEAAFLRQRQVNQALMGRGLAGSGLQQLTQTQGQLQLSQQLGQQATQAAGTRAGLYQQYQQNVGAAEQQANDLYTTIMNTAVATGKTGTDLTDFANTLAKGYGVTLTADQLGSIESTGGITTPSAYEAYTADTTMTKNANALIQYAFPFTGNSAKISVGDKTLTFTSPDELVNQVKELYKDYPFSENINISYKKIGGTEKYYIVYTTKDGSNFTKMSDAIKHEQSLIL